MSTPSHTSATGISLGTALPAAGVPQEFLSSSAIPNIHAIADTLPRHVGIIMDGNRRWARKQSLAVSEGHKAGAETLENIVEECGRIGIETLTVYAFSSENFVKRTKQEVDDLMRLLMYFLRKKRAKLQECGAKLTILGE